MSSQDQVGFWTVRVSIDGGKMEKIYPSVIHGTPNDIFDYVISRDYHLKSTHTLHIEISKAVDFVDLQQESTINQIHKNIEDRENVEKRLAAIGDEWIRPVITVVTTINDVKQEAHGLKATEPLIVQPLPTTTLKRTTTTAATALKSPAKSKYTQK